MLHNTRSGWWIFGPGRADMHESIFEQKMDLKIGKQKIQILCESIFFSRPLWIWYVECIWTCVKMVYHILLLVVLYCHKMMKIKK